ncbi:type I restriction endonuclease subunit M [Thiohalocapsa marina]|uniref:Type I restriction endonuclease subunit M n=1 Tax=Thiohalocapsa marina TaxID=424902 RepID=A0A5M8FNP5_9GAMM|nr:type I restriction endonuclease subunit M [Thiohalocapsa marina]
MVVRPENRHERQPTLGEDTPDGRWRAYAREDLLQRDKASLDLFWLRDASMTDLDSLPAPEVLVEEILDNLRSALASFEAVSASDQ